MNLLNNKLLLRNLLFQGDQLNTLSGGVTQVTMDVKNQENGSLINIHAPGISAESLKVIYEKNALHIYATLNYQNNDKAPALIPIFYRKLDLPTFADNNAIEAQYHENKLEVFVPIGSSNTGNKKEIEIKQI
ncbi:Hsp20/alpha crystallin family protein [Marivirga sp. S37H4]|uniref:Hsp20/alpha crystallin family protein n=1 Tax=Marivirga aurantiaca TaxID=2802615 RepID=A0A934WVC6_9BACT|nr:Hsp20/alpha crystallin family protein [Marivirga aurantiaca]MBK6263629.1 Hsp20/alpha crystallin family protein [Marivirga aurantiaca]